MQPHDVLRRLVEQDCATQLDSDLPYHPPGERTPASVTAPLVGMVAADLTRFAERHAVAPVAVSATAYLLTLGVLSGADRALVAVAPDTDGAPIGAAAVSTEPGDTRRDRVLAVDESLRASRQAVGLLGAEANSYLDGIGGVVGSPCPGEQPDRQWPLRVDVRDDVVEVTADGGHYPADQLHLFARSFAVVLSGLVGDPEAPVGFDDLVAAPRTLLMGDPPPTVLDGFLDHVTRHPEAAAVSFGAVSWTYRELGARVDQVAARLAARGFAHGDRAAVLMSRSPEMIAAIMGVLRAGGVCVPLDVAYPAERITTMITIAEPSALLVDDRDAGDGLVSVPDATVVLDRATLWDAADTPATWVAPDVTLDDHALILFTSGSTGVPKGAVMPHRPWAYYVRWQCSVDSGAAGLPTLQFAPSSFDVSFMEIFSTLVGGGELVLIDAQTRNDPAELLRTIDDAGVARVFLPFVALQQMVEAAELLDLYPRSLRVVISSGEQLRITDEIRAFCVRCGVRVLENQFGPTETQIVSRFAMSGDPATFPLLPPVGPPMDYLDVQLLDEHRRPVPHGAPGEIYVGGIGLPIGYRGRPDLTDAALHPHPLLPGERLYRMGDIARYLPSGDMVCLGRRDGQVKVRGFRVEPAEVEIVVRTACPEPVEVAVVAVRRGSGEAFLVAFLIGDRTRVDLAALRATVADTVPAHMVPSDFVWVDAFARTPSGKRDDAALRTSYTATTNQDADTEVSDTDPIRGAVRGFVAEALDGRVPGPDDDLLLLGVSSLTFMRLAVLIERRFGVRGVLRGVEAAPTASAVADRIRAGGSRTDDDQVVTIRRATGARRSIVFVHPLGGTVHSYGRLARHLSDDVGDLYAVRMTEPATPARSLAQTAQHYLGLLRDVVGSGPVTLVGWSYGGFVAAEMAALAGAEGSDVEGFDVEGPDVQRVVLVDSSAPGAEVSARGVDDIALTDWFLAEIARDEHIGADVVDLDERLAVIARVAAERGLVEADDAADTVARLYGVARQNWLALTGHTPSRGRADIHALWADEPPPASIGRLHGGPDDPSRPASAESLTSGRWTDVSIPGDHVTLMEQPHVRAVAEVIESIVTEGADRLATLH